MTRAVFLDRDGTINDEAGYINHMDRFRLLPRVEKAIRAFNELGFATVVITNQGGVAKGFFTETFLKKLHLTMIKELRRKGAKIDAVYYCPHHPHGSVKAYSVRCRCRKPSDELVKSAIKELGLVLDGSYIIGDQKRDIEFGRKLGLTTILVKTGYGKGEIIFKKFNGYESPDYVADDLYDASKWILKREGY
ncbi:MAG TPA: HAD family hydrolase [bacterium]